MKLEFDPRKLEFFRRVDWVNFETRVFNLNQKLELQNLPSPHDERTLVFGDQT